MLEVLRTRRRWHPAPAEVRAKCAKAAKFCWDRGASLAKLVLHFSVSNTDFPTPIVGTAKPKTTMRINRFLCLSSIALFVSLALGGSTRAGNPIVPGVGMADAHGVVYDGRVYLYASHDFSPENKGFLMKDWWVWSSADLVNWTMEGTLKPEETFLKRPFNDCWASFGERRNHHYYWYFSAGRTEIGVVEADSPKGPWHDPLGKPLVAKGLTPTEERDPDIFIDDDGKAYMIYGTFNYFLVRLNEDMVSLAEMPRSIQFDRRFGPYGEGKTDDKPSLHKRNGLYYLSWSSFYAVSTNLYGPYTYKGSVIDPALLDAEFHYPAPFMDRHGNFFEFNHQWYYTCNDRSRPGHSPWFRDVVLTYVHYRDNGDIAPVHINALGVGQYDARQPRIEAEDYFDASNAEQRECPSGGFEVRNLREGSYLIYPKVQNLAANPTMSLRAACGEAGGASVEVRADGPKGALLGVCQIIPTSGWDQYRTVSTNLKVEGGTHDLCLVVRGGTGERLRLDWFSFAPKFP